MIDQLIRWSLHYRAVVAALSIAFLAWGIYTAREMPLDVLPDLTAPTVTILVESRGMVPTEMESLVTLPIESALNGSAGVRRVRSATAVGVAVIWVEFEWGEEIHRARQIVTEKINLVSGSLPAGVERPYLAPISSIMGEVLFLALESNVHSALELRTAAETIVRRRLLAVSGVSQVIPTGGGQKQYQVLLDANRLRQYNVTLHQVETALRQANRNTSAGFRVSGGQEYLIQGLGRVSTVEEIGQIVVTAPQGRPVLINDVAVVRIGPALKRAEASHNAQPAVILGIQKQPGANTLALTRALDSTIDGIERTLPKGMRIDRHIFRQADFIERSLDNLREAIFQGALLVVLVVLLFLVNLRATFVTLLALPLSLLAAILGLKWMGLTINAMSLGGLAIAIGVLVDDAIIDVENVLRRLRLNARLADAERLSPLQVIYRASSEIRQSIVFATLIVGLVFLPLFLLTSVEGRLLRPLGLAYVIALFASLVVALTVTPALCLILLPRAKSVVTGHEPWLVRQIKCAYRPVVAWSLDHSVLVMGLSVLLLAGALATYPFLGRAFLPEFNEGTLTVSAVTVPGTSLAESDQLGSGLERILLSVPEVTSTARRTGRAELDEHVQGVESAEIDVNLQMKGRSKEQVLAGIREKATLLPGMNVTVGQPISHRIDHMLSGTRANIAVKIFGDDLMTLRALARRVQAGIAAVPGVVDLSTDQQTDIPALGVKVDPVLAARLGLQAGVVAETVQTAFAGMEVGQILEGQVSVPLVVRFQTGPLEHLRQIRELMIDSPLGPRVPLGSIAEIREDRGPNFITREAVQRKIVVQCNVAGRDLRGVVNEIQKQVARTVAFPEGYRVEYGGQFESETSAANRLLLLSGFVIVGILLLLMTAFGSFRDAMVIMLNLPFALVGGVAGVFLSGGILSVASIIGFITLFGIATRNGIMLVSHVRQLMEVEGETDLRAAILRGASERVCPILMTALAAGLALIPVALGAGKPGSEIQAPMAMVILSGLLTSTLLTMIVIPAVLGRAHRMA
ncbi:MAG: efflux RND transporter permease subunit [Candidatus Solibacter usitatus]|nr:efflux RND transporter permease subunit [Candidatus Solibacter usitatus]